MSVYLPDSRIIVDSREKLPWRIPAANRVVKTLDIGDYALEDYPDLIRIERKSIPDLVGSILPTKAQNAGPKARDRRTRLQDELIALGQRCRWSYWIIEGAWSDISEHNYESLVHPRAVMGTLITWSMRYGVPIVMGGDREHARALAFWYMRKAEQIFREDGNEAGTGKRSQHLGSSTTSGPAGQD